jgi:hypothetical protein
MSSYPKLQSLHKAMLEDPRLSAYFQADCYTQFAFNNPGFAFFLGKGYAGSFGPTVEVRIGRQGRRRLRSGRGYQGLRGTGGTRAGVGKAKGCSA